MDSAIKRFDKAQRLGVWQDARLHLVHHISDANLVLRIGERVAAACSRMPERLCRRPKKKAALAPARVERVEHIAGGAKRRLPLEDPIGSTAQHRAHCSEHLLLEKPFSAELPVICQHRIEPRQGTSRADSTKCAKGSGCLLYTSPSPR